MKRISRISGVLLFTVLLSYAVYAQNSWIGSYEFEEDGGKTTGGTQIYIVHQLDILETDDGLIAMIQSNGFQTSRDLIAATKVEGNKLLVYFEAYGEHNTFQTYQKGDLLFTLEKTVKKETVEIRTIWDKFQPVVPKHQSSGKVYFQKVNRDD